MVAPRPAERPGPRPSRPGAGDAPGAPRTNRIDRFLKLMNDRGGSDLHIAVGQPPLMRLHGQLDPIRYRALNEHDFEIYMREIAPADIWQEFLQTNDVDFGYEIAGFARFRVNMFRQYRGSGAVFRLIPSRIFTVEQLGLPPTVNRLTEITKGLVLVTGPTGSGKSTTLASVLDKINAERNYHIITIEDPIEFVYESRKSLVTQREVGANCMSFADGLRAALREDPNLVLVGELRDLETMQLALTAAESGLLVFATLHTNSAAKTVDRIVNVFPADEQDGVRGVLGDTLRAVVAQQLLPSKAGGRLAVLEILFGSPALSTIIREGKTRQITNYIEMGKSQGMITMDQSLVDALREDRVDPHAAYEKAVHKKEFRKILRDEFGVKVGLDDDAMDEFAERAGVGGEEA